MLLGRLELFTVLVLFTPAFWRVNKGCLMRLNISDMWDFPTHKHPEKFPQKNARTF